MNLSTEQYQQLVNQLAVLCSTVRQMPFEDMVATIEAAEAQKAIQKPTEDQVKNMADIKRAAEAALEFKRVAIDIASSATERKLPRIIVPGSMGWQ
jgi:hypothetical protein